MHLFDIDTVRPRLRVGKAGKHCKASGFPLMRQRRSFDNPANVRNPAVMVIVFIQDNLRMGRGNSPAHNRPRFDPEAGEPDLRHTRSQILQREPRV
jgi:hypothetical protein